MTALRIVIGCDEAGFEYKQRLIDDLTAHPGVADVVDVGVDRLGTTPYPSIAVAAAEMVAVPHRRWLEDVPQPRRDDRLGPGAARGRG
jgi:hypothetical protein